MTARMILSGPCRGFGSGAELDSIEAEAGWRASTGT